ncbi:2OG-Fe(II) oxygenase [Afifella pfennigii]|uniref:2OG-Fe(II) oxygenase n=1 Tax=Afifella pfennigii TaxID=209897 RepID=UPI000479BA5C|nr:2OG-Fe(II) oxygenase [Afifella pfennigii]
MLDAKEATKRSVRAAVDSAELRAEPYPHALLQSVLPEAVYRELKALDLPVVEIGGLSGTREAHNSERSYLAGENLESSPGCRAVAEAFQDPEIVGFLQNRFGADLAGTYLRMEYAQDVDGFWLVPHTDIGVKRFTLLIYLSDDPSHADLGTDIYVDKETHIGRSPFRPNAALLFVPSDRTWHGFEKRPINGVRRSLIVNYVTDEWRAREQLAFPRQPVLQGEAG